MKLLATRRNGETELLDITMPVTFTGHHKQSGMWQMHDAQGTDYFFNIEDGTYDGWGRAVMANEEGEKLLVRAHKTKTPPVPENPN